MNDESREWMQYADENLRSAELLLKSNLYNPCLQNAQQAIEKMLKARLIEKGVKIKKTHSIGELIQILQDIGVNMDISDDDCELIDSIYLPSKYPVCGILPDYEPDESICRQCLSIAERVRELVDSFDIK